MCGGGKLNLAPVRGHRPQHGLLLSAHLVFAREPGRPTARRPGILLSGRKDSTLEWGVSLGQPHSGYSTHRTLGGGWSHSALRLLTNLCRCRVVRSI